MPLMSVRIALPPTHPWADSSHPAWGLSTDRRLGGHHQPPCLLGQTLQLFPCQASLPTRCGLHDLWRAPAEDNSRRVKSFTVSLHTSDATKTTLLEPSGT